MPELPEQLAGLDLPHVAHLDQYFGPWAIEEERFRAAVERIGQMDLRAHVELQMARGKGEPSLDAPVTKIGAGGDKIAIVELSGPLMKQVSSLSGGTSTVQARAQIHRAARDDSVAAIVLRIDSPGGTVSGTQDLADEVAAAAKRKPVVAYIEDLGASAAYWIASQASKVYAANKTTLVGSIGTYAVLYDMSARAAMLGVKVHVIRAGDHKGAGTPGTEITPEQLARWQTIVGSLNEQFLQGVAQGRKLPLARVQQLATGDVHVGEAAQALGLIDGVQSFDATLAQLIPKKSTKGKAMSESTNAADAAQIVTPTKPLAASYQDLVAALPGASSDFLCKQLEAKATVEQATRAFLAHQQELLAAKTKEADEAKAAATAAAAKKPGQKPVASTGQAAGAEAAGGDAIDRWEAAVAAKVTAGKKRDAAIRAVAIADPDLHAAYLAEYNAQHGGKRRE